MALKDHASYYYRSLKDNPEEVKRTFTLIEGEYSKNIKEKDRLAALLETNSKPTATTNTTAFDEDVFNNLSLVYRKKEYKFIKPFEYYMAMRKKEIPGEEVIEDPESEPDNEEIQQQDLHPDPFHIDFSEPFESSDLKEGENITSEDFE